MFKGGELLPAAPLQPCAGAPSSLAGLAWPHVIIPATMSSLQYRRHWAPHLVGFIRSVGFYPSLSSRLPAHYCPITLSCVFIVFIGVLSEEFKHKGTFCPQRKLLPLPEWIVKYFGSVWTCEATRISILSICCGWIKYSLVKLLQSLWDIICNGTKNSLTLMKLELRKRNKVNYMLNVFSSTLLF